jgi:RNA polymerase sigma factor (sigma-70 family)
MRSRLANHHSEETGLSAANELYANLIAPIEAKMIGIVGRVVRDPDDAADVFQEVQADIWRRLETIHRHPNPQACILRICINRSYDALRKRSRREREVPIERADAEATSHTADFPPVAPELVAAAHSAVASLPPQQGQAVLLRCLQDAPYAEVAAVLGCSEAAARSHVSKGITRLRRILLRPGVEEECPKTMGGRE